MKRGPYKKRQRSLIPKACLQCGGSIENKLLFFPSTASRVKYCSKPCKYLQMQGRQLPESTKKKMSDTRKTLSSWNKGIPLTSQHKKAVSKSLRGANHWNWQGGLKPMNLLERNRIEYKQWREAVFSRDGYKCKISNSDCVHEVHAHHILRFSEYPELRFDVSNGITLCKNHHPLKRSHEQELAPFFKTLIS